MDSGDGTRCIGRDSFLGGVYSGVGRLKALTGVLSSELRRVGMTVDGGEVWFSLRALTSISRSVEGGVKGSRGIDAALGAETSRSSSVFLDC